MSNYDRIAISDRPDFYFSSNSSTDQSDAGLYGITNGLTNVGQPIIVGNPSSWRVSSTESLALDANPIFFRRNTQMEFVIQALQPDTSVCIFGDTSEFNGIFIDPAGVELRFIDADLIQRSVALEFEKWPEKMYLALAFDEVYCTLRINNKSAQLKYRETDPDSITDVLFKTTSTNTYYIDGIGIYSNGFQAKADYVDAPSFDYLDFINKTFSATGSVFDGYRGLTRNIVSSAEFVVDPMDNDYYVYTLPFVLGSDEDLASISIESNYRTMNMQYLTNDVSWTAFVGQTSFIPSTNFFLLQVRVESADIAKSFILNICSVFDNKISTRTPALMTPNGGPLYPESHTIPIVNFPDGVELYEISYEGEWTEYVPNSIEIIFMPKATSKTIIFENSDGSVSCGTGGSVSGFTTYLNGVLVTDLDDVRINQWNHLVLTDAAPTADTFYLNSNSARTEESIIEYSFIAAYPSVLPLASVEQAYSIVGSFHRASIAENPTDIAEGAHDGASPFKVYTYAWAIIGGGGV